MNKNTFMKYGFFALLVLNIALLCFVFFIRPKHGGPNHRPRPMQESAKSILDLNPEQDKAFRNLAQEHHQKMVVLNNDEKALLTQYFSLSFDSTSASVDSVQHLLDEVISNKNKTTLMHFKDVKALLNENQLPQFQKFVEHAMDRIMKKSGPKRRGPNP